MSERESLELVLEALERSERAQLRLERNQRLLLLAVGHLLERNREMSTIHDQIRDQLAQNDSLLDTTEGMMSTLISMKDQDQSAFKDILDSTKAQYTKMYDLGSRLNTAITADAVSTEGTATPSTPATLQAGGDTQTTGSLSQQAQETPASSTTTEHE